MSFPSSNDLTPAMRQYLEAKQQVPDALLMFRMGDFYELFFEDAVEASQLLEITLTTRDKGAENPVPMCGVPHHAVNNYVAKIIAAGRKVAICDQIEDPRYATGIVKREITRVVSPGVVFDLDTLDATQNNFLAAVAQGMGGIGFACVDASTGAFRACHADDLSQLRIELARLEPREVIFPTRSAHHAERLAAMAAGAAVHPVDDALFDLKHARDGLEEIANLDSLPAEVREAAGGLVAYLRQLQRSQALQLAPLELYELKQFLVLDETAVQDLELFRTIAGGERKGSLLGLLDRTATAMGARLLRRWIAYPLIDVPAIECRLDAVQELLAASQVRAELAAALKKVHDVERLGTRAVTQQSTPRELSALARSMGELVRIRELLSPLRSHDLVELWAALGSMPAPLAEAAQFLADPAPVSWKEGGIFRGEYRPELAELTALTCGGRQWLLDYEARLRERTAVASLKVGFNRVFGYYIEVTRPNLHLVPADFIRKQTLVNAERFFTPELKEYEDRLLHAEEKRNALEEELFFDLLDRIAQHRGEILAAAAAVAKLDVLATLAELAHRHDYHRPRLDLSDVIELKDSRHPVVEKAMPSGRFVPNDVLVDGESQQILVITGPNMAGKSTVMRQTALIVILAQMGSFVPAAFARIGITDRIFTRVGATDSLARGLSTFMVEMKEASEIVKRATRRSLVILDELGRGTSTYDGLAIAWSVAEYIHDFLRAKTLFATHYHELTQLTQYKKRVRNYNIAVKEFNDEILFLHRLVEGAANRSYGVQVARLAGIPRPVIDRAREILLSLEEGTGDIRIERPRPVKRKSPQGAPGQPDLFAARAAAPQEPDPAEKLRHRLKNLSLDATTPIEALNLLHQLKKEAGD